MNRTFQYYFFNFLTDNDFTHNIRSSSVHYEKVHIIVARNHELKMTSIRMLGKNTCNGKKLMKTKRSPASADSSESYCLVCYYACESHYHQ